MLIERRIMSYVNIEETAIFSYDLYQEAEQYVAEKRANGWKVKIDLTGAGSWVVKSSNDYSFDRKENK